MARVCIFCGAKADSYEHVFPNWINDLLLAEEFESEYASIQLGIVEEERRFPTNKAAGQRARVVCDSCNTGWMAKLEGVARPILTPMILNRPTVLDMEQQLTVALWAVKTAMVGESIMYQGPSFSQDDRDLVREQQQPPLRPAVRTAAFSLNRPVATRYVRGVGSVRRDGTPFIDLYVHTIQIVHLVLAVRGTDTLPASDNRSLERIAEPGYLEIPVWPPVEKCRWPPTHVMDEEELVDYSGGKNLDLGQ